MKDAEVPWPDVVRFVRQLNHDIRNHLNALELQAALLNEIAPAGEVKDEIKRLRGTLATVAGTLQKLSTRLAEPKPNKLEYRAASLMDDLQKKFERDQAARSGRVKWSIAATDQSIEVDPQLLQEAVFELIDNAFQFSPADASFEIATEFRDENFVITIREPKTSENALTTSNWGREPLKNPRHGHYGVGLMRARAIVEAHGGELRADYDAKTPALLTTILLPVSIGGT